MERKHNLTLSQNEIFHFSRHFHLNQKLSKAANFFKRNILKIYKTITNVVQNKINSNHGKKRQKIDTFYSNKNGILEYRLSTYFYNITAIETGFFALISDLPESEYLYNK